MKYIWAGTFFLGLALGFLVCLLVEPAPVPVTAPTSKVESVAKLDLCQHDATTFRCVKYLSNYDGDTVRFDIPNVHALLGQNASIRVNHIDTPEMRGKGVCEKSLAMQAREYVASVLKNAKNIELRNIDRGKYFRIVADIYADEKNLSDLLVEEGYAVAYGGGKKPKVNWCGVAKK